MRHLLRIAVFSLGALWLVACHSGRRTPAEWVSTTTSAPSEQVLWEVALIALSEQHFPLGSGVDPTSMTATSGWRHSLAPFKGEGYRHRARVRLEPLEPGKYRVSLQVEKETNEDVARPMDLQYAKWKEAPDDVETAQVLLTHIRARMGEALEVGEKRSNLPPRSR